MIYYFFLSFLSEFEAKYNKYRLVTLDEEHLGIKQEQVKVDLTSKIPSKLPRYIQDTMKEFVSSIVLHCLSDNFWMGSAKFFPACSIMEMGSCSLLNSTFSTTSARNILQHCERTMGVEK